MKIKEYLQQKMKLRCSSMSCLWIHLFLLLIILPKELQNAKSFHKFLKNHCHYFHYVFQIKKFNVMMNLVFIAWSIPYDSLEISQNSASFLYHFLLHQKNITKSLTYCMVSPLRGQTILCTHTITRSQG